VSKGAKWRSKHVCAEGCTQPTVSLSSAEISGFWKPPFSSVFDPNLTVLWDFQTLSQQAPTPQLAYLHSSCTALDRATVSQWIALHSLKTKSESIIITILFCIVTFQLSTSEFFVDLLPNMSSLDFALMVRMWVIIVSLTGHHTLCHY